MGNWDKYVTKTVAAGMNIRLNQALTDRVRVFRDRSHAGAILAEMLEEFRRSDALVIAIPSGGVPVAAEIAGRLGLELDVMPVSKILYPWTTESGFGAVAFDGTTWIDKNAVRYYGLDGKTVAAATAEATEKIQRRIGLFRGDRPFPQTTDRSVILVDDGIAGGYTMRAGIAALNKAGTKEIAVAVPTASTGSLQEIAQRVDTVYCANMRGGPHFAVADAYENWTDVDEARAVAIFTQVVNPSSPTKTS